MTPRRCCSVLVLLLCVIIFETASAQTSKLKKNGEALKVFLGPIPKTIDPTTVTSFTEYVVIQQMTRGLTKLDTNGQIKGDLAESWKISDNGSRYIFTLKAGQKFSNGDPVEAESFVGSFKRQIKKGRTIHFDFNEIASVLSIKSDTLEIKLKKSDHLFISKLLYPEFALLHKSDFNKSTNVPCEWKITSGMTILKDAKANGIKLFQEYPKPREIELVSSLKNNTGSAHADLDFFIGIPPLSEELHRKAIEEFDAYSPRLAFTFFFSIGAGSILAKDLPKRASLFALLYQFREQLKFNSPFHFRSKQLYLEDGPGRTGLEKLLAIRNLHEKSAIKKDELKQLNILLQKTFPYQSQLVQFFAEKKVIAKIETYSNFDEYEVLLKKHTFDLIQSNNDFSALDLTSNIMVTLNPQRPLVDIFGDKDIEALKVSLESEETDSKRIFSIQKIEELMLERAYVFPIYHMNMYFYVKKTSDHALLSRRFPEVAVWKIN